MKNEPVAIIGILRFILSVAAGWLGITLTDGDIEKVAMALLATYAAIEIISTAWQRSKVSPVGRVNTLAGYDIFKLERQGKK